MRTFARLALVAFASLAVALTLAEVAVRAGSANLTTPAAFDTAWTSGLAVAVNNATCQRYGQPNGCAAVPICTAIGLTRDPSTGAASFQSCTIYTVDGPGETAFAQDSLNYELVLAWNLWLKTSPQNLNASWCAAWKAAGGTNQQSADTAISAPAGAFPPCP